MTSGPLIGLDIGKPSRQRRLQRCSFGLSLAALLLLLFLLGVGVPLLMVTLSVALANTLLLFIMVTVIGLWLCHRTSVDLADSKLKILITFWLLKLIMTLFLLYAGWIPQLDPNLQNFGFDPQRYFFEAWTLIENGWNPRVGSNYQGIIFLYGAIFYLFGHNPVIPALINAFLTLLGTLFLIRCVYGFVPERTKKDWTIASLLLVPEVLWYDVMTGRDSIMAVLLIFAILSVVRYLFGIRRVGFAKSTIIAGAAFLAILAVRPAMALPVVISIGLMVILLRAKCKKGKLVKVLFFCAIVALSMLGPVVQKMTGGLAYFDFVQSIEYALAFESNVAAQTKWSEDSIGLILASNGIWQIILSLPAKMLIYLAAPLPNMDVSVSKLINGNWSDWQNLMVIATSALMLLGLPFVLAGSAQTWRFRKTQPALLALHITFWIVLAAIAGGNIIIHERYRVMSTLLLFACMWYGYTRCSRRELERWGTPWFMLLTVTIIFYMVYKYVF